MPVLQNDGMHTIANLSTLRSAKSSPCITNASIEMKGGSLSAELISRNSQMSKVFEFKPESKLQMN